MQFHLMFRMISECSLISSSSGLGQTGLIVFETAGGVDCSGTSQVPLAVHRAAFVTQNCAMDRIRAPGDCLARRPARSGHPE